MRRTTKQLCILAAILVLCAAAYLGVRAWNAGRTEEDESYGLDTPARRIIAQFSDGTGGVLLVGDAVNGNYYARLEEETTVYTISSSLVDETGQDLLEMIDLEEIPAVTDDSAASIVLTLDGAQYAWTRETVAGEEEEPDSDVWRLNGEVLSGEDSGLSGALSALAGLSFQSCHAWRPDSGTLSACGMDAPARLTVSVQSEAAGYTLLLGGTDEEGNYYAMLEGSEQLNVLRAASAQALLGLAQGADEG